MRTFISYSLMMATRRHEPHCAIVETDGPLDVAAWIRRAHNASAVIHEHKVMDGLPELQQQALIGRATPILRLR